MPLELSRPELLPLLRCPDCRTQLAEEPDALVCKRCLAHYGAVAGRPVLLTGMAAGACAANDVIESQARARTAGCRSGTRGLLDAVRAATTVDTFADDRQQLPRLVACARGLAAPSGFVLDVGACEQYYRKWLEQLGPVIGLDVAPYGAADLVGDAHRLPLGDESVAVVSAVEVLEHLRQPWVFVLEAARVLAPGGLLIGVAPQYCPTHGFPHDYFRFTRGGLEALTDTAGLQMIEAWPLGGEWATLFHWYWANRAREHRLRRVPGINLFYHLWFQGLAWLSDQADRRAGRGLRPKPQQHNDHIAWAFVARKPQ